MKKKRKWSTIILLGLFFVGLCVLLYPAISSYWNSRTQSEAIVDYEKMLVNIKPEDYGDYFVEAEEYNAKLYALGVPFVEYPTISTEYHKALNLSGNGMMGYISIEKLNLELPLYHTTDDDVLSVGAGHLEGTSLPVGGENTHSVVSAHRGLPNATLFTNLDHLEIGDTFSFTILDRTITYEVDQILTVLPEDASQIQIIPGGDYCTLLTCTPYGKNTHRLLVRGQRLDTITHKKVHVTSDAYLIDTLIVTPIVALPMLFVLIMIVLFKPIKKEPKGVSPE